MKTNSDISLTIGIDLFTQIKLVSRQIICRERVFVFEKRQFSDYALLRHILTQINRKPFPHTICPELIISVLTKTATCHLLLLLLSSLLCSFPRGTCEMADKHRGVPHCVHTRRLVCV